MERRLESPGDSERLAALLGVLVGRGVTAGELLGTVEALRALVDPFEHPGLNAAIDTCGTGGDGLRTFNLSTATALLVAACGVPVVKHGNRAVSSNCGSADLLEAVGIAVDVPAQVARERLERTGFTFLFAPRYHTSLAALQGLRRALGVPTVLNLAAPLVNPARIARQLVGVADGRALEAVRGALAAGGARRGYVVHGAIDGTTRGADELTPCGPNVLLGVGGLEDVVLDPRDLGLERCAVDALRCTSVRESVRVLGCLFAGERGPLRDALLLNAAAALVVAEFATGFEDGLARAAETLDAGRAAALLDALGARTGGQS
ncbi:anthranilate phosphoribosyltransferase [Rohdeia mirabilis]|uniref:anthranilate phosphoribosyltransferase n=1 Tax=Rohdeia mirabilis TaxID=2528008 RepID=UPI003AF36380